MNIRTPLLLPALLPFAFWAFGFARMACVVGAAEATAVEAREVAGSNRVVFVRAERAVALYHTGLTPLPHVHELLTPAGVDVIAGDTTRLPHPCHWGVFFGASLFDGDREYDFFHGRDAETPVATVVTNQPSAGAAVCQTLEWRTRAPAGKPLLRETRRVGIPAWAGAEVTLLEWESELHVPAHTNLVAVDGYDFVGFGVRLRNPDGRLFSATQTCDPGANTRRFHESWCAATYEPETGKVATVAIFEHPGNSRVSATWTALNRPFDFGYIGPGLCTGMGKAPLVVTRETPARLRYAVAAWDGAVAPATIDALCDAWLARSGDAAVPSAATPAAAPAPVAPAPVAVGQGGVSLLDCAAADAAAAWRALPGDGPAAAPDSVTAAQLDAAGADGLSRLKLTFGGSRWPTLSAPVALRDWTPFGAFHADVVAAREGLVLFRAVGPAGNRGYASEADRRDRWEFLAYLRPGTNHLVAVSPKLKDVAELDVSLYNPRAGETLWLERVRLTAESPRHASPPHVDYIFDPGVSPPGRPPLGCRLTVLGTDWQVASVTELAGKVEARWQPPVDTTVAQHEEEIRAEWQRIRQTHPGAKLAVLREGAPGFDPARPEATYTGWTDAGTYMHPPTVLTVASLANFGTADRIEVALRLRPAFFRADLACIPAGATIHAARLLLVRHDYSVRGAGEKNLSARTLFVAEPCLKPWQELEINPFEYARGRFWQDICGTSWEGPEADFAPVLLAHGPGGRLVSTWDFTYALRYWVTERNPNHGFCLYAAPSLGSFLYVWSREAREVLNRPALVVIYEEPPAAAAK